MLHVSSFRMNDKIETEVEIEGLCLRRYVAGCPANGRGF